MRQIVIQEKKDEDGEKYLTVDSEDDWHESPCGAGGGLKRRCGLRSRSECP